MTDESWRALARCTGLTASFFPDPRTAPTHRMRTTAEAKELCRRCPAVEQCLDYALTHRITDGVWGGLSEEERASVLRRGRLTNAARAAAGGTG